MSAIVRVCVPVLCLFPLLLGLGCRSRAYTSQCWNFTSLPVEQQRSEFRARPLDEQLDLYLCKMSQHPADSSYADPIAEHGSDAIQTVIAKMRAVNDPEKDHLLYILEVMSQRGFLRKRVDVYAELSEIISGMRDITRQRSEERLKKIAINSRIRQFTYTTEEHPSSE